MINLLDALYKLGKLYIEKENLDQIDVLLDNKKIGAVVLVEFIEDSKGNFSYNKVYHEDYDKQNKVKYLYKKGSSRGTNITPSTLIGSSLETTFNIKFFKWFENNKENGVLFNKLYDEISENHGKIYTDLENIVNEINVRDNILISVVIINTKINYLNDYDEFRDILIKNSLDKYQGPKKIKGNSVCYLCDNYTEVYGLVSNSIGFAFSTPEKIGNVPGNDIKNQWKLLPICSDCALYLNAGKNFIEEYLNFSEFGLTYYIIPSFLFESEKGFNKLYHYLQLFKSKDSLKSQDVLKIENTVSRLLKNFDNYVEFKFLFYKSKNNAFDILSYIESVIPSWLNKLYNSQIKIEQYDLFHEDELKLIFGKNHNGSFLSLINKNEKKYFCVNDNWYKKFLKDFFYPKNKENIDKIYLDIVSDIISNSKVDYNFLLSKFMSDIRLHWRTEKYYDLKISVLKSLMLILLLNDLNIFYGGNKLNFDNEEFSIELILDSSSKKATFLLGVLTRKLLNIQLHELDTTPFFNKLWGLSLDHKKIKKLYPMVINKLREYNITYLELEEEISHNLILSEKDWNLTRDETSYYFVLGYTLYKFDLNEGDDKNE